VQPPEVAPEPRGQERKKEKIRDNTKRKEQKKGRGERGK